MRKGVGMFSVVMVGMLVGCGSSGSGGTGGSGGSSGGKGGAGGAGNTSGGGPFTTSVPSSTPLTGLSGAQQTQLCKDFTTYADTVAPELCKLDGLLYAAFSGGSTDADVQAACAYGYATCLTADGGTTVMCNPNGAPSTCKATVGDLTSCLNMQTAVFAQVPSCSTLTVASLAGAFGDGGSASMTPAICMQFDTGGSCDGAVSMPSSSAGTP
jgi:hypothetical protein